MGMCVDRNSWDFHMDYNKTKQIESNIFRHPGSDCDILKYNICILYHSKSVTFTRRKWFIICRVAQL